MFTETAPTAWNRHPQLIGGGLITAEEIPRTCTQRRTHDSSTMVRRCRQFTRSSDFNSGNNRGDGDDGGDDDAGGNAAQRSRARVARSDDDGDDGGGDDDNNIGPDEPPTRLSRTSAHQGPAAWSWRSVQAATGRRTSWRSTRPSAMEPGQLEQHRLPLQSLLRHLSIHQSFFPFASPMLIARNRQRCDGWPVPEPSRLTPAFGAKSHPFERKRLPHEACRSRREV